VAVPGISSLRIISTLNSSTPPVASTSYLFYNLQLTSNLRPVPTHEYGSLENAVLDEIPVPEIGMTDVLIKLDAASINPLDLKLISGRLQEHFPLSMPYPLGTDLAGTVVEAGSLAIRWKKGDRVFARLEPGPGPGSEYSRGGAFAEFASVPAKQLAAAPVNLSLDEAAGLPTGAGAAWQAIFETAHLQPGQRILILGGSGGVAVSLCSSQST